MWWQWQQDFCGRCYFPCCYHASKASDPISIQSNLPHIPIKVGNDLNEPNCPTIRCAVDTCAALTTGSFHFFAAIAKRYLHCVQNIFAPQDYASIILMGIVWNKMEAVTTELDVGFLFRLPYKTSDGNHLSFMVATGPNVSVDTIIGLPFIKGIGMIIDTVDDMAECKCLKCPPFPIDHRRTSNQVPVMDEPSVPVHHAHGYFQQMIRKIENLEQYYETKVQGQGSRAREKKRYALNRHLQGVMPSVTSRVLILHLIPKRICLPVGFHLVQ